MIGKGLVIGLVAGAFGGLVGLGGGVVMVPMLVGMTKLRQQQAHGTSLVALIVTGLVGAATYFSRGRVDLGWPLAAVLLPVGLVVGFLSGMMGVGGGNMMVPAMVLLAGFPQVLAQGTSLLAMVPAGIVGAHAHWQLGNVARALLPGVVPGILAGTLAGSALAMRLPELALRFAFAAVLIYTGVVFLRTKRP